GKALQNEGYKLYYASDIQNKFFRLFDMCFKTIFYSGKIDYVLIDTYSTSNFWYALGIGRLCQIVNLKYIPILHGGNLPKRYEKSPFLTKNLLSNAYLNVAPSRYLFEFFQKKGIYNLEYIPNTIHLDDYKFKQRLEFKPKLLWVRSFSSIYNPQMALEVLQLVLKNYPNAQLCMVGPEKDGALAASKKYAEKHQLSVIFTRKLAKREWINLSQKYDIFINTTHFDNTPLSVIEAMALGLPVVSTNVGGIPFLLNDKNDALLVNDNDSEAMAEAIYSLLKSPQKGQFLAQNARESVEKFDWNLVSKIWQKVLK
ncbi:MAG: glycosyltransferase family 4 protein, partial [Leeuwenhoekiella sp.]